MPIELLELLHNLSDRDWEYCPDYKIDKNEADKITYAITQLKLKLLSLEHFNARNNGRWSDECECSVCGNQPWYEGKSFRQNYKYCPNCGAKMVEPQESEVNNG